MQKQDAITLQLARVRDIPDIVAMSASIIEHGLPRSWTARRVLSHIKNKECTVLVARSAGRVAGFAIMEFGDHTAHLNLLAVHPHFQRRGVGKQMLDWLHDSAIMVGTFIVNLELRAENAKALRFYRAMGYEECGYVPRYYSNVEDAVRMQRNLARNLTDG